MYTTYKNHILTFLIYLILVVKKKKKIVIYKHVKIKINFYKFF